MDSKALKSDFFWGPNILPVIVSIRGMIAELIWKIGGGGVGCEEEEGLQVEEANRAKD